MKNDKEYYDMVPAPPVIHLHIHASSLRDLGFVRELVNIISDANGDDTEFVRALSRPVSDMPAQGGVQ